MDSVAGTGGARRARAPPQVAFQNSQKGEAVPGMGRRGHGAVSSRLPLKATGDFGRSRWTKTCVPVQKAA